MTTESTIQKLVDERRELFISQDSNSTPYLIMTIFGDSVIPHGGEIWLGSLVQLLEPLGISERLVRTSVFRLTKEGWIESNKVGRKSYYRARHAAEIEKNEQRIYYQQEKWDGHWRLVMGVSMEKATPQRDEFRKQLLKNGFCSISSNVFGHPTFSYDEVYRLLKRYELEDSYAVLQANNPDGSPLEFQQMGKVIHRCATEALSEEYQQFVDLYSPLYEAREDAEDLSPRDSFLIRALMINDYRRVLWHDTVRSNMLFGEEWIGRKARRIAASIYCSVEDNARACFREIGEDSGGAIPRMAARYKKRFKHLI